jgi:hypothetical protein
MSKLVEFDDFEQIIMSSALAKGKVEYNDVSSQIEPIVKEKGSSLSPWETFNQTVAKLRRKDFLDDKNRPNPLLLSSIPAEILQRAIYKSNKRLEELEADLEKVAKEKSEIQSRVFTLERELDLLKRRFDKISPPTVIISKDSLEKGIENFIGYSLSAKLSKTAKSDLEDAIKCLYCGIPTPAAMISLRASEEAVRKYYEIKFGESAGKMTWKEILDKLVSRSDVDKILLGHLDYIRTKRNEAEHPEKIFQQDEAENTFLTVINVIKEIYTRM